MTSRELLDDLLGIITTNDEKGNQVLVSAGFLPDTSALKTALRGGDWSHDEYTSARIINEIAASRADGRDYTPDFLLSPLELEEEKIKDEWRLSRHASALSELRGEGR